MSKLTPTLYQILRDQMHKALDPQRLDVQSQEFLALAHANFFEQIGEPSLASANISSELLRVFFNLLRDNDSLPVNDQLDMDDVRLVQSVFLGVSADQGGDHASIDDVFAAIQGKLETGHIGQARLLIFLFEYQPDVQAWNERNLYLEDMALRFPSGSPDQDDSPPVAIQVAEGESPEQTVRRLSEHHDIHLLVPLFEGSELEGWEKSCPDDLEQWLHNSDGPVRRKWRLAAGPTGIIEMADIRCSEALYRYLLSLLKVAYFQLLVSSESSWTRFVPALYQWLVRHAGPTAGQVFSATHRQIAGNHAGILRATEESCEALLMVSLQEAVLALDERTLRRAVVDFLRSLDGSELAPGNYSLSGFVLDRALGLEFPESAWAAQVHRLY